MNRIVLYILLALFQSSHGFTPCKVFASMDSRIVLSSSAVVEGSVDDGKSDATNMLCTDEESKTASLSPDDVTWDWQSLAKKIFVEDKRPVILFDGVCNLCNGGVNAAIDLDDSAKFRFCSLQSKAGQSLLLRLGRDNHDISSIILVNEEEAFYSSDAVSRIFMELDPPTLQAFGQLGQMVPPFLREGLYQFVADNRYRFGEVDSCRLDFDGTYTARFVQDPDDE